MEITELQRDLAATFRWTARLNMHEGVANHFSACVPGSTTNFYVNKAGIHFSQIKASDLILVTKENIDDLKNKPDLIDPTAINIHGTIHQKVPHAKCIFHVHSKFATALSTLKDPIMKPIDQNTMIFYNRVSVFNEFGGLGFEDESIKMANALGNKQHMLLANHGIITTGETIAEGFNYLYYFERAAETYLTALSTNKELNIVSDDVAEKTAQETANYPIDLAKLHLQQIRLILDKEEPEYKNWMSAHIANQIIKKEWTDYNNHMNMAYYVLVFDQLWEIVLAKFKMGEQSAKTSQMSTMVVETHTTYNNEVKEGDEVEVNLTFFDHDKKRIHFKMEMIEKSSKKLSATLEMLSLYIDLSKRKVSEFEEEKVKLMDEFINLNKSNFNSDNLVITGKLKK